ncbi:hypothetical protein BOTBODRAFT_178728, partial [Botryobasidium botryosum FD-172 SS1]
MFTLKHSCSRSPKVPPPPAFSPRACMRPRPMRPLPSPRLSRPRPHSPSRAASRLASPTTSLAPLSSPHPLEPRLPHAFPRAPSCSPVPGTLVFPSRSPRPLVLALVSPPLRPVTPGVLATR